ncbi:hypothetical protein ACN9TB_09835 [Lactococcus lactis]
MMDLSTILKNAGVVIVKVTAFITFCANLYRMFKATPIEKRLETYNQTLIRHILNCILWWIFVMVEITSKIPLKGWKKSDLVQGAILSLIIFFVVVILYIEYQNFSSDSRKKIYFIYKQQSFEFVNRIDQNTLLLSKKNKNGEEKYKFLSYGNFTFEDKIHIEERFPEHRMKPAFEFYVKLLNAGITFSKIRFYVSFSVMIIGLMSCLSLAYSKALWTLWIFLVGLILGAVAFKNISICLNNVWISENQLKKGEEAFELSPISNKGLQLIIYLIACTLLGAGVVSNFSTHIVVGMLLIIASSIILSYIFIEDTVLKSGRSFIAKHKIRLTPEYLMKIANNSNIFKG